MSKVTCPYCGEEMERAKYDAGWSGDWRCYVCPNCEAESPKVLNDLEGARQAAMRRAEPGNRVLTLAEVYDAAVRADNAEGSEIAWLEYRAEEAKRLALNGYREPHICLWDNGGDDKRAEVEFYKAGVETEQNPDPLMYGKSWRCWLRKPTDQEIQNTPWEG